MILALWFLAQMSWAAGVCWFVAYQTGRNTERDSLQIVVDRVVESATWSGGLPAGSSVEGVEIAGMSLLSGPLDVTHLSPGTAHFRSFPVRSDTRIAVRLRTYSGSIRIVPLEKA